MIEPETFRAELAEFLDRDLPRQLPDLPPITAEYWGGRRPELAHPSSKRYCDLMAERGLTAPTWPREYGGGGLTPATSSMASATAGPWPRRCSATSAP